jgi:hypothetical protein
MLRSFVVLILFATACGNITRKSNDAGVPIDGQPDALVDAPVGQSREIVSGAKHLSGATYQFDVEIGHSVSQRKITGPTYTLEGNASVKP